MKKTRFYRQFGIHFIIACILAYLIHKNVGCAISYQDGGEVLFNSTGLTKEQLDSIYLDAAK